MALEWEEGGGRRWRGGRGGRAADERLTSSSGGHSTKAGSHFPNGFRARHLPVSDLRLMRPSDARVETVTVCRASSGAHGPWAANRPCPADGMRQR